MRRSILLIVLTPVLLLFLAVPAAATDDDIPGASLAVGGGVSQTVSFADPSDVYSVILTAGQEVYVRCDPGNSYTGEGFIHLLVPGAPTIDRPEVCDEVSFGPVNGGTPYVDKHGGYFHYIPPVTGVYYLWVEWRTGTLEYHLSVAGKERTLSLATDADDLPGTAVGPGTVTGVVSTLADPIDVYAVGLTAGQAASVRLTAVATLEEYFVSTARVSLLGAGATSAEESSGDAVAGPLQTTNQTAGSVVLEYTPARSGTYYVLVEAGPFAGSSESGGDFGSDFGSDFAYTLTTSGNGEAPGGVFFPDVSFAHPYYAAIMEPAAQEIILGGEDGGFHPDAPVTRQQFAKMIVRTLGLPVTGAEICPFNDVAVQTGADPFYPSKYVAVCAREGITTGKPAGKSVTIFDALKYITREQLVTMVARAVGPADVPDDYEAPFGADGLSLSEHHRNARAAACAGLLDGLQGVGPSYAFSAPSSRGECAQILYNLSRR